MAKLIIEVEVNNVQDEEIEVLKQIAEALILVVELAQISADTFVKTSIA